MVHRILTNLNCDEFCCPSLNGALCTASRDEKPGALCWCTEEQDPYPCDLRKCASLVHGLVWFKPEKGWAIPSASSMHATIIMQDECSNSYAGCAQKCEQQLTQ
eukprot:1153475-Pelagomonas_calceolata.AAC.5